MKKNYWLLLTGFALLVLTSCESKKENKTATVEDKVEMQIKEEAVSYQLDSTSMNGWAAWDASSDKKRPVVMVVHEWWGLNDYTKSRVKQLAELGYYAFAVDLFGNGKVVDNPTDAQAMVTPFYKDPTFAKPRFDAALAKALSNPVADSGRVAAIGYCFGGTQVLNMALLGENLKGVVSFHGGLETAPVDKNLLRAQVLVCNGEADPMVPADQVAAFKKKMDSIAAPYRLINYPGATHAFTNPNSTETGKKFNIPIAYNAAADTASWNEMKAFLGNTLK
jgi:dienelactone hydrolase